MLAWNFVTTEYGYDADRKRVWKKFTPPPKGGSVVHSVYVYAGPNCIAEYPAGTAAASPTQEYVYAQEIDSLVLLVRGGGSDKYTITRNQQWSVTALAELASGTIVERYTYDHFGKRTILESNGTSVRTTSSYGMHYGYTSRRHDAETDLMYFRARYYDPHTAEFISTDPLEYVDGMSLFRGYFVSIGIDFDGNTIRHSAIEDKSNLENEWDAIPEEGACWELRDTYRVTSIVRADGAGNQQNDRQPILFWDRYLKKGFSRIDQSGKQECSEDSICCFTKMVDYARRYTFTATFTSSQNAVAVTYRASVVHSILLKIGLCMDKDLHDFCGGCQPPPDEIEKINDRDLNPINNGPHFDFAWPKDLDPKPEPRPNPPIT